MTDLHDLLERDGRRWRDGFRPPDLDAVLAEATRPRPSRTRWVWPIVAAVLLLAVPLVTVLLRSAGRPVHPATPGPGTKLIGLVPWTGVAVSQGHDGRAVSVWVDLDRMAWCLGQDMPPLQASTVEKRDKITIQVRAYVPPGYRPPTVPPGAVPVCASGGHFPVPMLVHLSASIGRRSLVDAATGQAHPVVPAADLPALTKLPAGYVDAGSSPTVGESESEVRQFGPLQFGARRTYRNGKNLLTLERYQGKPAVPVQPVQATGTVLGQPAQIGGRYGSTAFRCVTWAGGGYTWLLCSASLLGPAPDSVLGITELLAVANSMR